MKIQKIICAVLSAAFICVSLAGCSALGGSGDSLFLKGTEQYADGEYNKAIKTLERAQSVGTSRYARDDVDTILGHCYLELNQYEKALEHYQAALDEQPEEVIYIVNLAVAYRQSGDNEKARELYMEALEIDPDYAELNSSLGSLYVLEGEPELAIEYFNKAIESDASLAVAYGNGAYAYALIGDFETADKYLDKAEELDYQNIDIMREMIEELRNGL